MLKKVLITGGAGFIGSHIAEKVLEMNYEVIIYDNLSTGKLSNLAQIKDHIKFIQGDIRDYDLLKKSLTGCDIIFHEAAEVSVPKTVKNPIETTMINDIGTLNVFETARQCGIKRVVFASSCAVYGDDPKLPKTENMIPMPKSPYAAQKIMGEYYAKLYNDLYNLETVCLRYFNVFGPRQDPSSPYSGVISIFATKAINNEQPIIYGDGNQYRDFVYVKDVVKANILAAIKEDVGGQVFNIGTANCITINELWELICKQTNLSLKPRYEPARSGDINKSTSDISHTIKSLKYTPSISFPEGLKETLAWYK